jgi:transcription antitermination factor NusG
MPWADLHRELAASEPQAWHALYVRHQHEKAIAEFLNKNGFDAFAPVYGAVRKWKDRTKHLLLPLFPCYVFLHGGLNHKSTILATPGVCSIVTMGGKPATMADAEVEAIRVATSQRGAVEPHPFLRSGDRVRVRSGHLEGIEGILVRRKNSLRLVLSAELLERSIAVEVDANDVEPLPARTQAAAAARW